LGHINASPIEIYDLPSSRINGGPQIGTLVNMEIRRLLTAPPYQ
jgi:hypothetical protein